MTKAIYFKFVAIILIVTAVYTGVFVFFYSDYNMQSTKKEMLNSLRLIRESVNTQYSIGEQITKLMPTLEMSNMRITVTDLSGTVIADTDIDAYDMNSHLNRKEIKEALKGEVGTDVRYSETLSKKMLYVAEADKTGNYIYRIAMPFSGRHIYVKAVLPACFATIIITLAFTLLIGRNMAKSITEPLRDLTNEILNIDINSLSNVREYKYDELNYIARAIGELSDRVRQGLNDIMEANKRTQYILDNMNDGLIITDISQRVISINKAAVEILDCGRKETMANIVRYTGNADIINGVSDAVKFNKSSIFDIKSEDGRIISVHISNIDKGVIDDDRGIIILLVDVTSERINAETRQSFFANASHELKTPITSIMGYSELLTGPIQYGEEQKKEFILRIKKESENLTSLINDILTISKIESEKNKKSKEFFKIKQDVEDITDSYGPMIKEKNILLKLNCEDINVYAERDKLSALISNLVSNAVKYNVNNGEVNLKIFCKENKLNIEISDTGIGIPKQDQQRVFERFYRVDKGRSKRVQGTGLGLAIVKHIVNYYNGTIDLKSAFNIGTTIKIKLNDIVCNYVK